MLFMRKTSNLLKKTLQFKILNFKCYFFFLYLLIVQTDILSDFTYSFFLSFCHEDLFTIVLIFVVVMTTTMFQVLCLLAIISCQRHILDINLSSCFTNAIVLICPQLPYLDMYTICQIKNFVVIKMTFQVLCTLDFIRCMPIQVT